MTISEALRIIERERDKAYDTLRTLPPSGRRNATKLKEQIEAYAMAVIALEKQRALEDSNAL